MKKIIQLIKPKIILVNLIAVLGGFFFALDKNINFILLFFVLFGTACMIASSCIFNNIFDIDIDNKMLRTKNRILIKMNNSIMYFKIIGLFLFFFSILIFITQVNILSCLCAILGFFIYVIIYSLYMKRTSIYDVIVGSISGAMPPLIGYLSINNYLDLKSFFLFLIYFIWQIPHSYSILLLYNQDYKRANIPTIVNKKGKINTVQNILFYIFIFILLISLFYVFNDINLILFIIILLISILWFFIAYIHYFFVNNLYYSRLLLYFSIIIILIINFTLIIQYVYL